MKKFLSKHLALFLAIAMLCSVAMASPASALGVDMVSATVDAENVAVPTPEAMLAELQATPYAHKSYYPVSGINSGVFHGAYSEGAVYELPNGTMHFSYSFYGGSQCYIRFYRGTGTVGSYTPVGPFSASNNTGEGTVDLGGGTYTVVVYNPYGGSNTEVIYAFNLFTR